MLEALPTKADRIREPLRTTKERRKGMPTVVYQLNLQKVSRAERELLRRAFLEARWRATWPIADLSRWNFPLNKVQAVEARLGDTFEPRPLFLWGSQVKQEIGDRFEDALRGLKALKENGQRAFVESLPLKQPSITFSLDFTANHLYVQKLGTHMAFGLHQILPHAEVASAVLLSKPSGFYLHVTCYLPKRERRGKGEGEGGRYRCGCGWKAHPGLNAASRILSKGPGLSSDRTPEVDRLEAAPPERRADIRILGSNPYIRPSRLSERVSPPPQRGEEITCVSYGRMLAQCTSG
jgi:hypothetical protein